MSITIKVEPKKITPVHNEVILVLSSDKSTEDNFLFITEVNIDGVKKSRIKTSPNPDGFGVVDLHKHLQPHVRFHIPWTGNTTFQRSPHNYTKYDVSLNELYKYTWNYNQTLDFGTKVRFTNGSLPHQYVVDDLVLVTNATEPLYNGVHRVIQVISEVSWVSSEVFIVGAGSTEGDTSYAAFGSQVITGSTVFSEGNKSAFNGVLDWLDVPSYNQDTFILSGTSRKFLTTLPTTYEVEIDDRLWFNITQTADTVNTFLEVISNNGVFHIVNEFSAGTTNDPYLTIGVGPYNMANTDSTVNVLTGSLPIVSAGNSGYTIQVMNVDSIATSELRTFTLVDNCSRYDKFQLVFLDRLGGFVNFTFNKVSKRKKNIKKSTYKENWGNYNVTNDSWSYNSYDRGVKRLDTRISETYTLTSDWVTEEVALVIGELIESPEVYQLDSGIFKAINILTTNYEVKKRINDRIFNYTIIFEYSFMNPTQKV